MLRFLIRYRTKPPFGSGAWIKTWVKRLVSMPKVCRYSFGAMIWRARGAKIASGTVASALKVHGKAENLNVGKFCSLGNVSIQAHAVVRIGDRVVINDDVRLITGSHDINSPTYEHVFAPISIGDYAWIATGAMILKGVTVGKGAVVAAGAVVTKDVEPFSVVGGNPARKISSRETEDFRYLPSTWFAPIMAWTGRNPDL